MTMDGVTRSLGYGYDVAGNRTSITFPDAVSYTYAFTAGGFFDELRAPYGSALVDFEYNDRGEVVGLDRLGGAPDQVLAYDEFGRLETTGWTQGGAQAATWSFTRNPASQIATEALSNPLYSWDAHPTGVTTANYTTNGLNQYTDVGNNDLCHDANGNLTADGNSSEGGWVYLYDIENRLVQMRARTDFANCPTNTTGYSGALAAQLEYDPMGRLYEVRGYNAGALQSTTRMLYDGDALVAEYNTAGTMLARYVHGPAAGVDDPLISYAGSSTSAANVRYLYSDARGSIVLTTNEAHSVPTVNTYDPYGLPGTTNTGRFQYTGQIWLEELGLYYYKARMYSPGLGRFMQTDPIGYEDNVNLYAYVGNDPVNGVDPTGLEEDPGDRFDTPEEAGRDAVATTNPDSIARNEERGGTIEREVSLADVDGRVGLRVQYYATDSADTNGTTVGIEPNDSTTVGDWHDHGDYSTIGADGSAVRVDPSLPQAQRAALDQFDSENFSGVRGGTVGDIPTSDRIADETRSSREAYGERYTSFLGTPSGRIVVRTQN